MKLFWRGFETSERKGAPVSFKRHVIVFYWSNDHQDVKKMVSNARMRHPTVKVKSINGLKGGGVTSHEVTKFPTILLLKDGREVDRITGKPSKTLLEKLFRVATT